MVLSSLTVTDNSGADGIWATAKSKLAAALPEEHYEAWIAQLSPLSLSAGVLALGGPNQFFLTWVRRHLAGEINQALAATARELGQPRELAAEFELMPVAQSSLPETSPIDQHLETAAETRLLPALSTPELPRLNSHHHQPLRFNPRFTFESFVVGEASLYAFSAAKALATDQALGSGSLFFVADHGLGKSHLAQALSQEILRHRQSRQIYYLTAEDFTNELVYALRSQNMEDFKRKYRQGCDVLILEDLHFLAGKEKVQQELAFTLDYLIERGRKVVFTAPQPPAEIPRLAKSLRSRLTTALLSPIGAPDYQTRLKILWQKAAEMKLAVPGAVLEFMAERLTSDVRCLESSLVSLAAKSRFLNRPLDLALAREAMGALPTSENGLTPLAIKELICRYFKLSPEELLSPARRKNLLLARGMGMYLCRRLTVHTLEEIGQTFGRKHSTALYAINQFEAKIKRDAKLKSQFEFLSRQVSDRF